jgi:zinc transporter ZupT
MNALLNIFLVAASLAGGSIPLMFKGISDKRMQALLAFSGAFLLGITCLHLAPESFQELGGKAGLYLLLGFFLQLFIQNLTHGTEHGHTHIHTHDHHIPIGSILFGMTVHAFMEGLPLGFHYRHEATEPALYLAVAAHKLPEAMLVASLVASTRGRSRAWLVLLVFSLVTPVAGLIANQLGVRYYFVSRLVTALIPIVAGSFLHIATTIFYESGTRQHHLTWQKILSMALGVGMALVTLAFE